MWLYCPNCTAQTNAGTRSLYSVFKCGTCSHRFQGIHAKKNKIKHVLRMILTPSAESLTETFCVHCGSTVYGSDSNWWPSVCKHCGRDLPKDRPAQTFGVVSQHSDESTQAAIQSPAPLPQIADDWDGCGPCTTCGFIFRMMFANAICPRCGVQMSWEDALFSCGSYPDSTPPERQ